MARGLQVTESNPIDGLEGRTSLLLRLAEALQNQEVFGLEARPGNMLGKLFPVVAMTYTNIVRLSSLAPHHPGFLSPHHSPADALEHSHGELDAYLASNAHSD
jgi:hypothetical protein